MRSVHWVHRSNLLKIIHPLPIQRTKRFFKICQRGINIQIFVTVVITRMPSAQVVGSLQVFCSLISFVVLVKYSCLSTKQKKTGKSVTLIIILKCLLILLVVHMRTKVFCKTSSKKSNNNLKTPSVFFPRDTPFRNLQIHFSESENELVWKHMENGIFFLQHIHKRQINNRNLRGKAADQELQITHQKPTNLAENTNFEIRVEGIKTQTYLSGKRVLEF